jgi:hypothetical protein
LRDFSGFEGYFAASGRSAALTQSIYYSAVDDYYESVLFVGSTIASRFYADRRERYTNGVLVGTDYYSANPSLAASRAIFETTYQLRDSASLCDTGFCAPGVYPSTDLTLQFSLPAGTVFSIASVLYADDQNEGTVDFFHTARLAQVEVSPGGSLTSESGALLSFGGGVFGYSAPVPEPASWTLMIAGFALVGAGLRMRYSPVLVLG